MLAQHLLPTDRGVTQKHTHTTVIHYSKAVQTRILTVRAIGVVDCATACISQLQS
jgi:hypothetical protein